MQLPFWLVVTLGILSGSSFVLAAALYSARTQRFTRVPARELDALDDLRPAIQALTRGWTVDGNAVEFLENGEGLFPRLLADFEAAERSIHIETFVWWKGDICRRVAETLSARARAGIEVRLMVDWVGALKMEDDLSHQMREAGVVIEHFNSLSPRTFARINKRTHRKLAIIDGRLGYIHGHGYAGEWEGNGDRPECWSDLGARLQGPIVARLQSVFSQHWMEESSEILADDAYFPPLEPAGDVTCQVVASSPRGGVSDVSIMMRLMIGVAREEILIQNPYFVPSKPMVEALEKAVERGVRVRVMTAGPVTDSIMAQYSGRHQYERLLRSGVEILRFQPTLPHQKVMVIDRAWSQVGSVNFDERSLDINAEVCLGLFDRGLSAQLVEMFERDEKLCKQVELESWMRRPLRSRLLENAAFLVHQQL